VFGVLNVNPPPSQVKFKRKMGLSQKLQKEKHFASVFRFCSAESEERLQPADELSTSKIYLQPELSPDSAGELTVIS